MKTSEVLKNSKMPSKLGSRNYNDPEDKNVSLKINHSNKKLNYQTNPKKNDGVLIYNVPYRGFRKVKNYEDESEEMLEKINRPAFEKDYVVRVILN